MAGGTPRHSTGIATGQILSFWKYVVSSKFFVDVAFFYPVASSTGYDKQLAGGTRMTDSGSMDPAWVMGSFAVAGVPYQQFFCPLAYPAVAIFGAFRAAKIGFLRTATHSPPAGRARS